MRRREFIALLGSNHVVARCACAAGGTEAANSCAAGMVRNSAFAQELAQLGWEDGRNVQIDVRWANGDVGRIPTLAEELIALQPDLIFASTTPVTAALQRKTNTIPIVFVIVADPVGSGFVAGLPRPGGHITGFTNVEASLGGKWLEILKDFAPGVRRVALIFNPDTAQCPANSLRIVTHFR